MFGFSFATLLIAVGIFIGVLVCFEIGRRFGVRSLAHDPDGEGEGLGAIEAALFGLLGLLLAFTFSGAASRFDTRRQLVVDEANAIGTAYLRVDLLPAESQPAIRNKFRQYLDTRLEVYRLIATGTDQTPAETRSREIQNDIWSSAVVESSRTSNTAASMLLLPALNQMFDIATTRAMSRQMHPPRIIFIMLGFLVLSAAAIAGFGLAKAKTRSWIHLLLFAFVFAITFYVILDIEYPRLGLIRVDAFDRVLIDLRNSMN